MATRKSRTVSNIYPAAYETGARCDPLMRYECIIEQGFELHAKPGHRQCFLGCVRWCCGCNDRTRYMLDGGGEKKKNTSNIYGTFRTNNALLFDAPEVVPFRSIVRAEKLNTPMAQFKRRPKFDFEIAPRSKDAKKHSPNPRIPETVIE